MNAMAEQLYRAQGEQGPVVRILPESTWQGLAPCEVVESGVFDGMMWSSGTRIWVVESDLEEVGK